MTSHGTRNKWFTLRRLAMLTMLVLLIAVGSAAAQDTGGSPPAPPEGAGAPPGGGMQDSATCGVITLDGEAGENTTDAVYDSSDDDVSALCLLNGAALELVNPTITKTGDTSSNDYSSFYGLNAAVLVGPGSVMSITGGTVTTDGSGTNGVFATGTDSVVTLTDVKIEAVGDGAHAVMATLGGTMYLVNVEMVTTDAHSGAVATDRGSGTITVTGGTVLTTGQDSPGIYSTGIITVSDATITATGAEAAVIEGSNTITLTDTDLLSSMADKWGVMLYQSFSGDAEGSEGVFTMTGGSLAYTAENGPLFFVTNATGYINLSGVEVTAGSGVLVRAAGTERWGASGENGGNVVLTADAQMLAGDLLADSISTLAVTLQNGSTLTGAINADNAAKAATLTLDANSTWDVTEDSYLTCLINDAGISGSTITNITGNGHTVYYDASVCSALGGQTYTLNNGGTLQPAS